MSKSTNQKSTLRTRQAILNLLKREGAMDSQTLADCLQVSAMAIRQHLYAMQDEHPCREQSLFPFDSIRREESLDNRDLRLGLPKNKLFNLRNAPPLATRI